MSKLENKIVAEVVEDYLRRRENRRSLEAQWQLNINFMMGNQYSFISSNGGIREDDKRDFWQEKEVFNHIAPIVETRISKICSNTPSITVIPASADEADIESAKLSKNIIESVTNRVNLVDIEKTATTWSEICGTVFYKVVWNTESGKMVALDELGKSIKEGDVEIQVVSPFEIFPDNLSCERMEDVKSIIHAKAVEVDEIKTTITQVSYQQNTKLSVKKLRHFINEFDGIMFLAHIERYNEYIYDKVENEYKNMFDLIEINARSNFDMIVNNHQNLLKYTIIRDSDAHSLEIINTNKYCLELEEKSINGLFKKFKKEI